jgi:hypothetical protein
MDHHVFRRNLRGKVKMIGYKDISYRKTIYKLTSAPDLGAAKFGDGV